MAQAVVDDLQVVDVDQQDGHLPPRARGEGVLDAIVEERAVGQLGELVVKRAVAQVLLEGAALVDVAQGQGQPVQAWVLQQIGGDALDMAPGAVGCAQAPLGLACFSLRAGCGALEEVP